MNLPTAQELAALVEFDTPTICNALEVVMPQTRKRPASSATALSTFTLPTKSATNAEAGSR